MKGSYKVTRLQYMTLEQGPSGTRLPTLWDNDPGENGEGKAIKVAVECSCDGDGNLMDVSISSDYSHVMFAEESQGAPEPVD